MKFKKYSVLSSSIAIALLASPVKAVELPGLETMVITASRYETALQEAPASISVIDREELQLRNADDLADALTAESGITITSVGKTRRGISIRGMPVEHTLYLIDGRRISSSNSVIAHSDFELSWLPASAIERIEVVRGPMSSLYGSDAMGGVVNIITRKSDNEFHGELSSTVTSLGESGDGNTNKTTFYLEGPVIEDKLSFSLGGEFFDRNNLPTDEDGSVSNIEGRESKQGQGKFVWTPDDNQTITASYLLNREERSLDLLSRAGYYTSNTDIDREQYSLGYEGNWEWGHLKLNAYQTNLESVRNDTDEDGPQAPKEIEDRVIEGHIGLPVADNHFVTVGGQLREETLYESRLQNTGKATADHSNVFLQDEWQVFEPLKLVAGVGVDNHEEYGNEVSPRIYAVYQLSDNIVLKGGYGEGFRAPSLTELSADYEVLAAGGRFWVEGNPDLEPERSKTYEASIEYQNDDWTLTTRLFENQLENLVQAICYTSCGIRGAERRSYQNIDESRIRGAELVVSHDITHNFNIGMNYTYLDTEDLATGDPLEDRPKYMGNLTLDWSPVSALHLRWRSEYLGKQYTGDEGYAPNYDLHHIDISYDISKNFTVYSGIDNLFDERLEDKSDLYSGTEPGREIRLGITAKF